MRQKKILAPGILLQNLVAVIEQATADDPHTSVASPAFLSDKDTGQPREHDVLLTYERTHHKLLTAIECRDRSRKVGVPEIEAFRAKCDRTGIHRGIIVSSRGFCATAIAKANKVGIGCMTLTSAQTFDWCAMSHLSQYTRTLIHVDIRALVPDPREAKLINVEGEEVAKETMMAVARRFFETSVDITQYVPGRHQHRLNHENPTLLALSNDGASQTVERVEFTYTFEVTETLRPARFYTYSDPATGEVSAQTVSFNLPFGEVDGELMLVRDAQQRTSIMLSVRKT